jgi:carbon storage regulator
MVGATGSQRRPRRAATVAPQPSAERVPMGEGIAASMLVLTRKTNQSIMIGDDVEVSVLSVSGDKVRIGIAAPRDVGVFRTEVYEQLERPAEQASDGAAAAPVEDE